MTLLSSVNLVTRAMVPGLQLCKLLTHDAAVVPLLELCNFATRTEGAGVSLDFTRIISVELQNCRPGTIYQKV